MTSDEAKKTISKMLAVTDLTVRGNMTAKMVEACRMAIKALEQGDALDKIRADIEELKMKGNSHNICFKVHNDVVESVLRIIDKYKTESEG